ncbi:MAG: hypothetical protein GX383_09105 [Clostridium sp.]|jgi:hypothetical protein|nr:hypothetical protein [Clostridium sp.]
MLKIDVNLDILEKCISQIDAMKSGWCKKSRPSKVGAGRTVTEMELLADCYEDLYNSILKLTDNTIEYFRNLKNSYEELDKNTSIG